MKAGPECSQIPLETSPHCKETPKQASKFQVVINALDVISAFILVMDGFLYFFLGGEAR